MHTHNTTTHPKTVEDLDVSQKTAEEQTDIKTIPRTPFRFILFASGPSKWWGIGAMAAVTMATILNSLGPYFLKRIIDGVQAAETVELQAETLALWGGVYVLSLGVMYVFWRTSGFLGMNWVTETEQHAFSRLYAYISKHSFGYYGDRFAGSVANKINRAAGGASTLVDSFMWGYYERILGLVIVAGFLFNTSLLIGSVYVGLVILLVCINIPILKYRRPHVVKAAAADTKFKGFGIDMITNMTAVRQYSHQALELQTADDLLEDWRAKEIRSWKIGEWGLSINNAAIATALGIIMFTLVRLYGQGLVTTGDVVLVVSLIGSTAGALIFIGNAMARFIRVYGEVQEGLDEVLVDYDITDTPNARPLETPAGHILFQNLNFKYPEDTDRPVFKDFNLKIPSGQRLGLVGQSGAGKTTFVSLLLRQHDVTSGAILIDGQDIKEVTQDSLREAIAVVPQEPALFHRTIRENIAYGKPDATNEEIIAVAKKAEAHDFITELPNGYDTMVGERGVKLSGGQRQRVAIARAMLKDAPILILDEATSALDSESEVLIQKALHTLMEGKTVIAIAHRLSTLREMDRLIVLENGQIIEDGTHDELAKARGTYQSLWEHQAGGFVG